MMAYVDGVETTPLIGTQGPQQKVAGNALEPEALAAGVEEGVHPIDFLAEELDEFGAVHGRPVELVGARKNGSGHAAGHAAGGEHGRLHHPLHGCAASGGRPPTLEALFERAAGTAEGEHEMLDEFLGAPEPVILPGVQLAPIRRLSG